MLVFFFVSFGWWFRKLFVLISLIFAPCPAGAGGGGEGKAGLSVAEELVASD